MRRFFLLYTSRSPADRFFVDRPPHRGYSPRYRELVRPSFRLFLLRTHSADSHRSLRLRNSIESRMIELQKKKENLAASALGDDDRAMGRLTPEDLEFLFRL